MVRLATPPVLVLATLAVLAACGGDDSPPGSPNVDRVIEAVRSRDSATLQDMIEYHQVACTTDQTGLGGPPPCRGAEAEGTLVDVVRMVQCGDAYLRPTDVPNALVHLLDPGPEVYAAFEAPDSWDSGDYGVVLSSSDQGRPVATQLLIEGSKIVVLDFGCGESPEDRVAGIDQAAFIIKPAAPSEPSAGT